jgi:hypothetical protein
MIAGHAVVSDAQAAANLQVFGFPVCPEIKRLCRVATSHLEVQGLDDVAALAGRCRAGICFPVCRSRTTPGAAGGKRRIYSDVAEKMASSPFFQ